MKKNFPFPVKSGILLSFTMLICIFGFTEKKATDLDTSLMITVYEGKHYSSHNSELWGSIHNLKNISKNDDLSSVIVEDGTVAKFYRSPNYGGCSFEIVGPYSVPLLDKYNCECCSGSGNDWDNEISSIRLFSNSNRRSAGVYGASYKYSKPKQKKDPGDNHKW